MTVINRIFLYIKEMGLNNSRFEKLASLPNGYISKIKGSPGVDKIEDILRAFPDINSDWLLYGRGDMLNRNKKISNFEKIKTDTIEMSREVFDQITRLTETVTSQQRTIELLARQNEGKGVREDNNVGCVDVG